MMPAVTLETLSVSVGDGCGYPWLLMNRLSAEISRLYFVPEPLLEKADADDPTSSISLVAQNGMTRVMVVGFERSNDWDHAATLYQAVQGDLELPPPAVSASGGQGYQLWFSLSEPVSLKRASLFLSALRRTYLPDIQPSHLAFWPDLSESFPVGPSPLLFPPLCHEATGKWSAFIDPGMGSMFVEEPGLGMAPMVDRQADLLVGLEGIKPDDFERTLNRLQRETTSPEPAAATLEEENSQATSRTLNVDSHFPDPKSFLLAVINDSSLSLDHRIEAAKVLMPYFGNDTSSKAPGTE